LTRREKQKVVKVEKANHIMKFKGGERNKKEREGRKKSH